MCGLSLSARLGTRDRGPTSDMQALAKFAVLACPVDGGPGPVAVADHAVDRALQYPYRPVGARDWMNRAITTLHMLGV